MVSTLDHMMAPTQVSAPDRTGAGAHATGILHRWFSGLSAWMGRHESARGQRDCYRALLGRDDHMLRDIGVTRLDLVHFLERLDHR